MLVCVLQTSAEPRASPTVTGSGRIGGTSWTRGPLDMEVWRWTTNAARPSKWAPLRDGPFLAERVCKIDMMHVVTPVRFKTCFLFFLVQSKD